MPEPIAHHPRAYLDDSPPIVLAHRGGSLEAPENSLAAVRHDLSLGLRYFETDVRTTRDGIAVLMHDPIVDRTTSGTGLLADLDWAEVARLRDASGAPPLRVDELLAHHPDLRLNIDVKEDRAVTPLVEAVREAGAEHRICLASFDHERLVTLRQAFGPTVLSSISRREAVRVLVAAHLPGPIRRRLLRRLRDQPSIGCIQVPPTFRGVRVVSRALVRAAHELGWQLHVWTINEPRQMNDLLDLGVDGLVTDRPSLAQEVIAARGQSG